MTAWCIRAIRLDYCILLKCLTAQPQRATSISPDPGAEPSRAAAQVQNISLRSYQMRGAI